MEELLVRSIQVEIKPIFAGGELNWLFRTAQSLKVSTSEDVVRQHLLFREGDTITPFVIEESQRILRAQKYLRNVRIEATREGGLADVRVYAQDTWSLIPQISYSGGGGDSHTSLGAEESDLWGLGKRLGLLYDDNIGRRSVEMVYDDPHVWGSQYELMGAFFDRNDGEVALGRFGLPFRSLIDRRAWIVDGLQDRIVGRIFEEGKEYFIFRRSDVATGFRYSFADGDPERAVRRFSAGYRYDRNLFAPAELEDYRHLGLNPADLSQNPALLPEDRQYSGPLAAFDSIEPDFVAMNYIDRFERVQDFNVGETFNLTAHYGAAAFDSFTDALMLSTNKSAGLRCGNNSFLNAEAGAASRFEHSGFSNTLLRAELKYFEVLGQQFWGDLSLGKHTLALSYFVDYGIDLELDRQFLVGSDNGLRGYDVASFSGDKRSVLNLEDRIHLMDDVFHLFSLGSAFFADVGGATDKNLGNLLVEETYADVGVGLRLAFPRVSGSRVFRIDLAFPLRSGPEGTDAGSPRVVVSGGQLFSSDLRSQRIGAERATVGVGFDR